MSHTLDRKISAFSVLRFAFPSIIMMVVMSLYTVVDGVFVARLIGTNAFSAVNIIYPLLSLVIALGTMFGAGTAALVSRKLGEGRRQEANENFTFILVVSLVLGVLISGLVLLFLEPVIYALGANSTIYGYCRAYALPLVFFLPASLVQLEFQSLFIVRGKPHIGLAVTLAGGLANVVLDYVFIAVFQMGIAGAAVATGIGYCIPAFYGLAYFMAHRGGDPHFVRPKIDLSALLKAVTNGSSEMVGYISTSVTTFLFNVIMMRHLGPDGVAAVAVLLYLDFVLIAVSLGYSMGVAPLLSFNHGSGNTDNLKKIYAISVWFCIVLGGSMAAFTGLFAPFLASVFVDRGTAVWALAVTGLRIFAVGYLFKGFNVFTSALFTAFSNGAISALLSFMRTLVFLVAALLGLTALFGVDGVWYASPVAELCALLLALAMTMRFRATYHYL